MKYFFTLFFLLFIIRNTNAQSTYQTQFSYSNFNQPYGIYKAPDNSTFVFGDKLDVCGSPGVCNHLIYVHHFNAEGKFLWTKDYHPGFSVSNPIAMATKDGGFVFLGRLYDTVTKTWKGGLLLKCNRNGDIVLSKRLQSKKYTAFYPKGVKEDNDGNLLLFYDVANDMYYSNVLQIVKLNANGNIIWNKTGIVISSFSNDVYEGVSFQQIGNLYYILGAGNCQICEGILTANILVMDTSNTIVNCVSITADGDYTSTYPTKILIKNNKTYLAGTYEYFPSYKNFLIPITEKPAQVTGISFSSKPFSLLYQVRNFSNPFPIAAGYGYFDNNHALIEMTPSNFTQTITQYDSLGRICPSYKSPYIDTTTTQKVFNVLKSRFAIIKDSVYLSDIAVFVSPDTLSVTQICSGAAIAEKSTNEFVSKTFVQEIKIYPNPVQSTLHISGLHQTAEVFVLSSEGAIVEKVSLNILRPVVPVAELKAGIYFIKIIETGRAPYLLSFIKE